MSIDLSQAALPHCANFNNIETETQATNVRELAEFHCQIMLVNSPGGNWLKFTG